MSTETKTKKDEARERREELNDIIAIMKTPQGRRFVWRLLVKARVFTSPYSGSTNDTMLNLGEHNLGLFIMSEILKASPESYLLMQHEHYITPETAEDEKND